MKPIPLSTFSPTFTPPVTGYRGSLAPVANSYDTSGHFRSRTGSANKRPRNEEIDIMYDLSQEYPPLAPPEKPSLNIREIKNLLVTATAAGEGVKALIDAPDADPNLKTFGNLCMSLLKVVGAAIDAGIVPLAATGTGGGRIPAPQVPQKPQVAAGIKELREALEKSDKETVVFDANLGKLGMANRTSLANAFSVGLRAAVVEAAAAAGTDPIEAVRITDDALSCASDMEFVGARSEPAKDRAGNAKDFYTMPIKMKFEDRDARINFEKQLKTHAGLRSVMSLPKPIRVEQAALQKALKELYPNDFIMVRPDTRTLRLVSYRKVGGEGRWERGQEEVALNPGTMLPGYRARESFSFPRIVTEPEAIMES
jgi:hypothetical protein